MIRLLGVSEKQCQEELPVFCRKKLQNGVVVLDLFIWYNY